MSTESTATYLKKKQRKKGLVKHIKVLLKKKKKKEKKTKNDNIFMNDIRISKKMENKS